MTSNKDISMKPILFNTPMVQALLNTKPGIYPVEPIAPNRPCKSQTRRVMKPQPKHRAEPDSDWHPGREYPLAFWVDNMRWIKPKYQVGDRLWVREVWNKHPDIKDCCNPKHCTCCLHVEGDFIYKASFTMDEHGSFYYPCCGWESPIFMPRDAARLFLEVREVRVERLQDITEADTIAEGTLAAPLNKWDKSLPRDIFAASWNAINGKGAWESNPWVWVYGLMRV